MNLESKKYNFECTNCGHDYTGDSKEKVCPHCGENNGAK